MVAIKYPLIVDGIEFTEEDKHQIILASVGAWRSGENAEKSRLIAIGLIEEFTDSVVSDLKPFRLTESGKKIYRGLLKMVNPIGLG